MDSARVHQAGAAALRARAVKSAALGPGKNIPGTASPVKNALLFFGKARQLLAKARAPPASASVPWTFILPSSLCSALPARTAGSATAALSSPFGHAQVSGAARKVPPAPRVRVPPRGAPLYGRRDSQRQHSACCGRLPLCGGALRAALLVVLTWFWQEPRPLHGM